MKTLLQEHIKIVRKKLQKQTKTGWYDEGFRDVTLEAYLEGLEKASRLVNKQKKL